MVAKKEVDALVLGEEVEPLLHASQHAERQHTLAFNVTGVDVTPETGPFEIAPGTQWDDGRVWEHENVSRCNMVRAIRATRGPQISTEGDISCRSALTVPRGTAHASPVARPVVVFGADALGVGHAALHD